MATTTYLTNPTVNLITPVSVDLTDNCSSATLKLTIEALENTAFGSAGRTFTAGIQNNELTLTLFQSYGAGEIEATLNSCFGVECSLTLSPSGLVESASNPEYTLSGTYLESVTPIAGSVGELSTVEAVFKGGTYVRDIT